MNLRQPGAGALNPTFFMDGGFGMPRVFTVYALSLSDPASDTETECAGGGWTKRCATLGGRELILSEMADANVEADARFDRYGIRFWT
jgi:hypothetical protein